MTCGNNSRGSVLATYLSAEQFRAVLGGPEQHDGFGNERGFGLAEQFFGGGAGRGYVESRQRPQGLETQRHRVVRRQDRLDRLDGPLLVQHAQGLDEQRPVRRRSAKHRRAVRVAWERRR